MAADRVAEQAMNAEIRGSRTTCTIERDAEGYEGAEGEVLDKATGQMVEFIVPRLPVFDGPCIMTMPAMRASTALEGGQTQDRVDAVLRLKLSDPEVQPGDVVTCTKSPDRNPILAGTTYTVLGYRDGTSTSSMLVDLVARTAGTPGVL